jgi:hypothetical protein
MDFNDLQPYKAQSSIIATESGMAMDVKDLQPKKAHFPIITALLITSDVNDWQQLNALSPIVTAGTIIDFNDLLKENASSFIQTTLSGITTDSKE